MCECGGMSCAAECGESCRLVGGGSGECRSWSAASHGHPYGHHVQLAPTYLPTYLWQRREAMSGELLFRHTIFELVG